MPEFNEEEMEEAARRVLYGSSISDDDIQKGLDEGVRNGDLEEVEPGRYRLTEQGKRNAEKTMADALEGSPPRAAADAHLYSVLQSMAEDEDSLKNSFEFGQHVLMVEHERLATVIGNLADDWAQPLAQMIREGRL